MKPPLFGKTERSAVFISPDQVDSFLDGRFPFGDLLALT
jgi:hypothetical protein